jgi:hypothetical protein
MVGAAWRIIEARQRDAVSGARVRRSLVKITAMVSTTLCLEFNDPRVTEAVARQMAIAFEAGWRVGVAKDMAMLREVFRQQFGHVATAHEPDVFLDFTFTP